MSDEISLTEEIKRNARKDRERLEKLCDSLVKVSESQGMIVDEDVAAISVAEQLTSASDSLSRINMQLIELVKLETKAGLIKKAQGKIDGEEAERLFDTIQQENNLHN